MFAAYVVVSIVLAAALLGSATANFVHYRQVLVTMNRADVPESWISLLGVIKVAGAVGLLAGIAIPLAGLAAALGIILFFLAALAVHIHAHYYAFAFPATFLALAIVALALGLAVYPAPSEILLR